MTFEHVTCEHVTSRTAKKLQERGCTALGNLAAGDEACRAELIGHAAPEAIVEAMAAHRARANIVTSGVAALCQLAAVEQEYRLVVCDAGGAVAVVAALDDHPATQALAVQGCAALRNFSADMDGGARRVIEAEGVEALTAAMQRHKFSAQLQQLACSALAHLAAVDEEAKRLIVRAKGVHLATNAMLRHHVAVVQEKGCGLLCNLAAGSDGGGFKEAVIADQGLDAIKLSMLEHPKHAEVQAQGVLAIGNVAAGSLQCKHAVVRSQGAEAIVAAMRHFASSARLVELGCCALCNLAADDEARPWSGGGGADGGAASRSPPPPSSREAEGRETGELLARCRASILEAGGVEAVVAAMRGEWRTAAAVAEEGCAFLRNLAAGDTGCRKQLVSSGGVEAVVGAMRALPDEVELACEACLTIANLAAGDAHCAQAVLRCNGVRAVLDAIKAHPAEPRLAARGAWALRNLAASEETAWVRRVLTEEDAIGEVVAAMGAHLSVEEVQQIACGALRNIAADNPVAAAAIVSSGGLEALRAALGAQRGSGAVQLQGCAALRNLVGGMFEPAAAARVLEAVSDVLEAMRAHPSEPAVLEQAAGTLGSMTVCSGGAADFPAEAAMGLLLEAMRTCGDAPAVQAQACSAVASLLASRHPAALPTFLGAEGVTHISRAIGVHREEAYCGSFSATHAPVQRYACAALCQLAMAGDEGRAALEPLTSDPQAALHIAKSLAQLRDVGNGVSVIGALPTKGAELLRGLVNTTVAKHTLPPTSDDDASPTRIARHTKSVSVDIGKPAVVRHLSAEISATRRHDHEPEAESPRTARRRMARAASQQVSSRSLAELPSWSPD